MGIMIDSLGRYINPEEEDGKLSATDLLLWILANLMKA